MSSKYRVVCKKCKVGYAHQIEDTADSLLKSWNKNEEDKSRCVHEYVFEKIK